MTSSIRKYESAQATHCHAAFHQVIVPLVGALELDVRGRQGWVQTQIVGAIAMGETHAFRSNGDNRFLVLDIDEETGRDWETVWSQAIDQPFLAMSQALTSLSDYALYRKNWGASSQDLQMWQNLFMQTLVCDLAGELPDLPARIQRAVAYMQANLSRVIDNRELAALVSLSPARFYELFRQVTGMTPQQYLTKCRLDMAKRLITHGHSLVDVADQVGFSDQSSFGRAFSKAFGLSPAKWRKQEFQTKKS
ncbi:MAG: helix-turn-helix domain-containing protein [Terasakiella sp.]|uniref:AraC family transcriptional regulator n=1 Tax=unclassified Terasakiella TaxID=2614952 RepID=UPI003AFF7CAF